MSNTSSRFPFFNEAVTPAGAEGWESMYPYFLVPSEETRDEENSRFWFADTMHWSHRARAETGRQALLVWLESPRGPR